MLSTPKAKSGLFLASSLCDGLEDNNIRQVATLLLNKDADPNILIPTHGVTPFHLVIGNESDEFAEEVTKLFLRHGGNPNVRSNDGMTPVHVAAAWGRRNILELLLANGGDPLRLDNDGRTPFHYAFDGKYFKVITLLSKYCENIQDKDDKPKYNMVLDKVLISNGDVIAEYVASKDAAVDVDNMTGKIVLTDLSICKSSSSSINVALSSVPNTCDITETEYKSLSSVSERPFSTDSAQTLNNLSQSDTKVTSNCSFTDLDFDLANLYLTDVMRQEKCFVSRIINHLSTSLASDRSVNETLHNYRKTKEEESTSELDKSFLLNEDVSFHKCNYYRKPRDFSPKLKNNRTPTVKRWLKHGTQSACKKKCKKILDKAPTLDNSIISMSPNFHTPNHKKKRNIARTPLTPSRIFNDSIISRSPNFATPVCACRTRNLGKSSRVNDYFSLRKVFKTSPREYQDRYVGFNQSNLIKKYIAQSTPRRKKKSIYKLHSARKRFEFHRYESVISDEFTTSSSLKPVNLDKTIFSADDVTCATVDSRSEYPSLYSQESSQHNYSSQLTMQLNEKEHNKDRIMHYDNLNHVNKIDKVDPSNSFNQMKKNEFANSFGDDKNYIKSENNQIELINVRRDIFRTDDVLGAIDASINNVKSARTTDSSKGENVGCIDCDTKKLLNEDLNMNISKTCKHEKNWRDDKFHGNLSGRSAVENNPPLTVNLPAIREKQVVHLSDFPRSSFLKIGRDSSDSKGTENLPRAKDFDSNMCKVEKNLSLLSYVSTQEEYKYEDLEEGVILLERRLCVTPFSSNFSDSECDIKSGTATSDDAASISCQNLPRELLVMDDATLRRELERLGTQPGPITSTTKQVYLKRLMRLRSVQDNNVPSIIPRNASATSAAPSDQIKPHLQLGDWLNHLDTYKSLEKQVFQAFASPEPTRRWREGTSKTSFTYLLLDPRVTQDLPNRCTGLTESETWSIFLNAIFYVGKGKRSRPFAHLYDAFNAWVGKSAMTNTKISRILDIWNSDHGVICLHVFQNVIPVEAYTREAVMIDAIGKEQLENCKGGEYYGIAATWSVQQKQKFGRYLLYKALQILIHEGESQLFPCNL